MSHINFSLICSGEVHIYRNITGFTGIISQESKNYSTYFASILPSVVV